MAKKTKKPIPTPARWVVERVDAHSGKWHTVDGCPSDFTSARAFAEGLKIGGGLDARFVRVIHTDVSSENIIEEFMARANNRISNGDIAMAADSDIITDGGDLIVSARIRIPADTVQAITAEILRDREVDDF